ncbi:hypothetical protein ACFX2I_031921 [Malus domestica]
MSKKNKGMVHKISICFESNLVEISFDTWWFDTGATIHVTNSLQGYISKRVPNKDEVLVFVGNGARVAVEFIGVVRLELFSGFLLDLVDVAYIPSMRRNLISVSKLVKSKFKFDINENGFSIFQSSNLIGDGVLVGDMFKLNCNIPTSVVNTIGHKRALTNDTSSKLWHKRLGHISKERMQRLTREQILPSLNYGDFKICTNSIKGKLINKKKKDSTRSTKLLELIDTDICGPFPTQIHDGYKYFITSTDDFSRFGYVYLLAEKSSAFVVFKIYKVEVESQLDCKIEVVRSDRDGEYYGKFSESRKQPGPFALFLQEHGIVAQYTNPGTPEQNGVSERRNRTLIEMVRSMMNNSKLHTFLWGKAIKTTNYLLNRVPSKSIPKTPFELWTNRKPVLNHLGI